MIDNIYKVGLYCRLSSDDGNVGDSGSIITQKMILEKYCEEHSLEIIDIYVDDGFSGLNYNRPSFQRMIADIEIGKINMVITKDLSRLGRDYIQTGYYTEIYFPTKHVRYVAITDNVDTLSNNNDIAPFKNILNDMYAKDLSRKIKIAKRQRAMNGYFIASQAPYGYKQDPTNKNKLIIDPEAAQVVRRIFEMALDKKGSTIIANTLMAENIVNPATYKSLNGDTRFDRYIKDDTFKRRGVWIPATINAILKDRVYVGDMVNRKYEIENYKTKKVVKVPLDQRIIVCGTHEAIIKHEEFDEVQKILTSRSTKKVHDSENFFKGIIFCANCGGRMVLITQKERTGSSRCFYKCQRHRDNIARCPKSNTITYNTIKTIVDKSLRSFISMVKRNEEVIDLLTEELKKNTNLNLNEELLKKYKNRQTTLITITRNLYEDYASRLIDIETYKTLLGEYQSEQKELKEKIYKLEEEIKKSPITEDSLKNLKDIAFKYIDEIEITQDMVNDLVSRIVIGYNKEINGEKTREIKIIYKFIEMSLD